MKNLQLIYSIVKTKKSPLRSGNEDETGSTKFREKVVTNLLRAKIKI